MPHLIQDSPFRALAWRNSRIISLIDAKPRPRRCNKWDDAAVRAGRDFHLRLRKARSAHPQDELAALQLLYSRYPGLYQAHEIFTHESSPKKLILEGRLLARMTNEQIAQVMRLHPDTVDWYEKIYYNVRDRLDSRDWIVEQIMVPSAVSWDGMEMDYTYRFFCYFGGPVLADFMLHGADIGNNPGDYEQCLAFADRAYMSQIRRRSAQAAKAFQINRWNVMDLFSVHNRIMELRVSLGERDESSSFERTVKAMLTDIPFYVGAPSGLKEESRKLADFANLPVEAIGQELLLLGMARVPDTLVQDADFRITTHQRYLPAMEGQADASGRN